ncbi:MAG: hypothetical protein WC488_05265 [Candidatus Micrarchaeia archaeon]
MSEVRVDRGECRAYYRKAKEDKMAAEMLKEQGFYSQAFSLAIKAFILYLDALNIADLGIKSSSPNHKETIDTFSKVQVRDPVRAKTKEDVKREYLRFIGMKNAADYTGDEFREKDVDKLLKALENADFFIRRELSERGYST